MEVLKRAHYIIKRTLGKFSIDPVKKSARRKENVKRIEMLWRTNAGVYDFMRFLQITASVKE